MPVIASYDSRWLEGQFHLELTEGEIRIHGSQALGGRRVETAIPLRSLQPRVERFWLRSRLFNVGLSITFLGPVAAWLLVMQFRMSPYDPLPGLALVSGAIGPLLMAFTFRRIEFARFVSTGGVPALDVARSGDTSQFENFIAALLAAITEAHRASEAV